jgi:hypothetical protein
LESKIQLIPVRGAEEFDGAFPLTKKDNANSLVIIQVVLAMFIENS